MAKGKFAGWTHQGPCPGECPGPSPELSVKVIRMRPRAAIWVALAVLLVGITASAGALWLSRSDGARSGALGGFREPQPYAPAAVYDSVVGACRPEQVECVAAAMSRITAAHGPVASLEALTTLHRENRIIRSADDHQLAHGVGRVTAERFGVNAQAFLLCPTSFNYGCQHGYFEYVLGRARSPRDAAALICGTIERDAAYSPKFKFYCYHGIGHGVMMAAAYDLKRALDACDSFESDMARNGCWQGAFMENVNAGIRGTARSGVFSELDPLAPCNAVDEKYRHECFINHAGWLMKLFGNAVGPATAACLHAPDGYVGACLQSIGLMVTNPAWQVSLSKQPQSAEPEKLAWDLCRQFPADHREQCVIGAADNIMNFDGLEVARVGRFCTIVPAAYRAACHERIGVALRSQTVDVATLRVRCASLGGKAASSCFAGAGL